MATNELVHQHGAETTVGFKVLPLPKIKRRGRPRVYNGTQRRQVAAALRKHGLTKGLKVLAKEKKLKVSLTLARDVAEEFGIKFQVGRPKAA